MPELTREMILSEPAGRRLDAWVAECVMGWKSAEYYSGTYWDNADGTYVGGGTYNPVPSFSSNILAAWTVVEKMATVFPGFELMDWPEDGDTRWLANFGHNLDGGCDVSLREAEADTAPLAICRAALMCWLAKKEAECE